MSPIQCRLLTAFLPRRPGAAAGLLSPAILPTWPAATCACSTRSSQSADTSPDASWPSLDVMAVWDDVKRVIVRLKDERPSPLRQWPDPSYDEHLPPFRIHLAAWAVSTAADLLDQFGDEVDLTVGALPFPPRRLREPRPDVGQRADQLDPYLATVELDGAAVVPSGHTLHHALFLRNLSLDEINLATNGQLTADVVDLETEQVVGGFAGAQLLRGVMF